MALRAGWGLVEVGQDYYVRQLRDMKGSVPVSSLSKGGLRLYGGLCGDTLARAHARGGDAVAIAGYVGRSSAFDDAITRFAVAYADQAERDYEAFMSAIASGRLEMMPGARPRSKAASTPTDDSWRVSQRDVASVWPVQG